MVEPIAEIPFRIRQSPTRCYGCNKTLLSVSLKEMIPEVKSTAPTLWQLFRYTLHTPRQAKHNKYKDPNAVQFDAIYIWHF
jgi:uncharacterized protein with PIN domain